MVPCVTMPAGLGVSRARSVSCAVRADACPVAVSSEGSPLLAGMQKALRSLRSHRVPPVVPLLGKRKSLRAQCVLSSSRWHPGRRAHCKLATSERSSVFFDLLHVLRQARGDLLENGQNGLPLRVAACAEKVQEHCFVDRLCVAVIHIHPPYWLACCAFKFTHLVVAKSPRASVRVGLPGPELRNLRSGHAADFRQVRRGSAFLASDCLRLPDEKDQVSAADFLDRLHGLHVVATPLNERSYRLTHCYLVTLANS
jgi:hypothetical protein